MKPLLSICIPTFNRCHYLIDSIKDLIIQSIESNSVDLIEICISDNASTDNTHIELKRLLSQYPLSNIKINTNSKNIGPDKNFIKALSMSTGKYTILKGDDDYFKPGGLKYVMELINLNDTIDFYISDVEIVDLNREFKQHVSYLRDTNRLTVNFKNEIEARNYFALCNSILALGSFISGVIIKTEAVKDIPIDPIFIGTGYSFEYYFWKYLLEGHLLQYTDKAYIQATVGTENKWGNGLSRDALDLHAFGLIGDYFFENSSLCIDFKNVVNRMYPDWILIPINEQKAFRKDLYPALLKSNHPLTNHIKFRSNFFYLISLAFLSLFPFKLVQKIRALINH